MSTGISRPKLLAGKSISMAKLPLFYGTNKYFCRNPKMFVGNDATGGLPITEGFVFDVRKSRQRNDDVFADVCCAGERRIVERVSEIGTALSFKLK